jgi:hypothetical protein
MRLLLALSLLLATPAQAGTYGPPAPVVEQTRSEREAQPYDLMQLVKERDADADTAWRRFWIGQGLAGADLALTCLALSKRNPDGTPKYREANPIFGKNAGCGSVAAIKVGAGLLQYFLARNEIRKNPAGAKKQMNWVIAINGAVVGWNIHQLTKAK